MNGYIYGLVCAAAAVGIAEAVIPESAKTRPYLKLVFGLALLLAVIRPFGEFIRYLPELGNSFIVEDESTEDYSDIADEALGEAYASGVRTELEATFGLSNFEVGVAVGKDRLPEKITIVLGGRDVFRNPHDIEAHIGEIFGCECIVVIG